VAEFVAGVATYVVLFLLAAACAGHARRPDDLPSALRAHGVLPAAATGPVGLAVTVSEGALVALLLAGLLGPDGLLAVGLAGGVAVFASYGGYGWFVVSTGRSGPCGCAGAETPMSMWVVGRALTLAGLSLVALVWSESVPPLSQPGSDLAIVLLGAATFAALLWFLPAAMRDPEGAR
jgi:hypothetical protein